MAIPVRPSDLAPVETAWGQYIADYVVGGVTFPGAPAGGEVFYRNDRRIRYLYGGDGSTAWLSEEVYTSKLLPTVGAAAQPYAATAALAQSAPYPVPKIGGGQIWVLQHKCSFLVTGGTALGASHKWVGGFGWVDAAGVLTPVATINIDSGASGTWRESTVTLSAGDNTHTLPKPRIGTSWTKTGTPGTLTVLEEFYYRLVG